VDSVDVEVLPAPSGVERKRLRFITSTGATSAIFERWPPGATLEAQLLPFLARKTDRVPMVYSRGLPPPHATLGPWVLIEDVLTASGACDGGVADVVRAKLAIERAVVRDASALRALGVKDDATALPAPLAAVPRVLVHGDLRCAVTRRTDRGVVITGWSRASFGCGTLDIARLVTDLEITGGVDAAREIRATYVRESGLPDGDALLALAERTVRSA
jgi:hypothetical protein